jgi:hypothetical protein
MRGNGGQHDARPAWPQEGHWIRMSMTVSYGGALGKQQSTVPEQRWHDGSATL